MRLTLHDGSSRSGQVLEVSGSKAVVQVSSRRFYTVGNRKLATVFSTIMLVFFCWIFNIFVMVSNQNRDRQNQAGLKKPRFSIFFRFFFSFFRLFGFFLQRQMSPNTKV